MPADRVAEPVGVVLAGGAGRRLGGDKPGALLRGRPLVAWVAQALGAVVGEVAVVVRRETSLPALPALEVAIWREPVSDAPPHPLSGLAAALAHADGRDVLACPVDLPFVSAALLEALVAAPGEVAVVDGQPLLGRFGAGCAAPLAAAAGSGAAARATIAALAPTVVPVLDRARVLFNVNTAADLARAEAMISAR